MANSKERLPIPLPMQREIRQRCGFGCVVCGLPLYEYEHMLGYVDRHVAEEIALLCDQHHREKTGGLLPVADVQNANANPYNLRTGVSKPYDFHYAGKECEVLIGSNSFTTIDRGYETVMVPVSVDGVRLVAFILADGHLLLNLRLFDECNNLILRIDNNALTYKPDPWDIQLVGRNLIVREAQRNILLDIIFEVPSRVVISRARLLCNGVEIQVNPERLYVNGLVFRRNRVRNFPAGLVVGPHSQYLPGVVIVPNVSRYPVARHHDENVIQIANASDNPGAN